MSRLVTAEVGIGTPVIGPVGGWEGYPAIAYGGGVFLVAWTEDRTLTATYAVYAARVKPDGTVLDPYGILIGDRARAAEMPTVASVVSRSVWKFERWRILPGCNNEPGTLPGRTERNAPWRNVPGI